MATPQTPATPGTAPDPANVQGNIFGGFNKPHQCFVYLHFAEAVSGRAWVADIADLVSTSDAVIDFNEDYKAKTVKEGGRRPDAVIAGLKVSWFNVAFSFAGLQALQADTLDLFPSEFRDGMAKAKDRIGDVEVSDPSRWIVPFDKPADLHAVAILAADDPDDLQQELDRLRTTLQAHKVSELTPAPQSGDILPGAQAGREHFGFKDGISQPGVKGIDPANDGGAKPGEDLIEPGEFVLGYPGPDPPAPPPAPPPYPGGSPPSGPPAQETFPSWAKDGSYLVFRRLRQNVGGFREFVQATAAAHGLNPETLASKFVGRYKSGAPLEMTKDEATAHSGDGFVPLDDPARLSDAEINNFDYEPQDADGHLVPRAAHIRKTYPRNAAPGGEAEAQRRRILRRGIPYGPPFEEGEPPYSDQKPPADDRDRGLLFLCYQRSLKDQFEFIQHTWVNGPDFPQAGDGRDPILSQDVEAPTFNLPGSGSLTLQRWVITTGGEYFFAPSIAGLRHLSQSVTTVP